jgi:hypothetical protein
MDLTTPHYVAFIKQLTVFLTEAMSFDSEQFTNNFNKVIKAKTTDHLILLEEHFIVEVWLYKKYEVQFEFLLHKILEFFSEP